MPKSRKLPAKKARQSDGAAIRLAVICIGASAGGLSAVRSALSRKFESPNIAVVLIQHIDASGQHLAHEVMSRMTSMPVVDIADGVSIEAGNLYIAPPHGLLTLKRGKFTVKIAKNREESQRVIDFGFASIAEDQGPCSVGVILSGEGCDGSQGLKAISQAGGMTIAQAPETADHPSMPESAIASGVVDHILKPDEIHTELSAYAHYLVRLSEKKSSASIQGQIGAALISICEILLRVTRHDFKHYKTSTLIRRIQRRMQVLQLISVEAYVDKLRTSQDEVDSLFRELLINVTSFFRDPEAFLALRDEIIAKSLAARPKGEKYRVWVAGCSTGEEVYSLAMIIKEEFEKLNSAPEVQIIATDIDEQALGQARKGAYSLSISSVVSPDRLSKYFVRKAGRYHISKEIRELCLFSSHNLINDPPFSHLDLISCRNVLIYLGLHLQKKLIPVFHYALKPNGYLFLGNSETLSTHKELFKTVSAKHRMAQRKSTSIRPPTHFSSSLPNYMPHFQETPKNHDQELHLVAQRIVLDEFCPRYAVVNEDGNLVSVSSGMNKYLQLSEGLFQNNILKIVHPNLRVALRTIFSEAKKHKRQISHESSTLKIEGVLQRIGLVVQPMPLLGEDSSLFMVVFQYMGELVEADRAITGDEAQKINIAVVEQLEKELMTARDQLDRTVQDLEASNEELKSSNEELLSMNEELQSANEELEASKEDVQIFNETLQRSNTDLENLLASTQIATLFLAPDLKIRGFTPAVTKFYPIELSDIGRDIRSFNARTEMPPYLELTDNSDSAIKHESELVLPDGTVYLRRIIPYKSHDETLDGSVVTFFDITNLREAEVKYKALIDASSQIVWTTDATGEVTEDSPSWRAFTGQTFNEWRGAGWLSSIHPDDKERVAHLWRVAIENRTTFEMEYRIFHHSADWRWTTVKGVPLLNSDGAVRGWVGMNVDITAQKLAAEKIAHSERRLAQVLETARLGFWELDTKTGYVSISDRMSHDWGIEIFANSMQSAIEKVHPADRDEVLAAINKALDTGDEFSFDYRVLKSDKETVWIRAQGRLQQGLHGESARFLGTSLDITDRKITELELKNKEQEFRTLANSIPQLTWMADKTGHISWYNDRWYEYTGTTFEEMQGWGWERVHNPELLPKMLPVWKKSLESGKPWEDVFQLRSATGEYRWFLSRAQPLKNSDGIVTGWFGTNTDIHAEKESKERLIESQDRLKFALEAGRMGTWTIDLAKNEVETSDELKKIFGVEKLDKDPFAVISERMHPDDSEEVQKVLREAIAKGTHYKHEYRIVLPKTNEVRWIFSLGQCRYGDESAPIELSGVVLDITERKLAESALSEKTAMLETVVAQMPTAVVFAEAPSGKILFSNSKFESVWRRPVNHLQDISEYKEFVAFHEDGRPYEAGDWPLARAITTGEIIVNEDTDVLLGDGKRAIIRITAAPVRDADDEIMAGIILSEDVTILKKNEQEISIARQAAEAASQAKTNFLANMSHEIRTPLAAIIGFTDLLQTAKSSPEDVDFYLDRVARNSSQLAMLIEDLLDLSKIEAEHMDIQKERVEPDVLLEDVLAALDLKAKTKSLDLVARWSNAPSSIYTDPVRLKQILVNVIGNAIKFTEQGSVTVTINIVEVGKRKVLEVDVTDTGIGLSHDQIERIFQPFMQADSSINRRFGGTGLGLVLSRKLARLLGGDLTLKSSSQGFGSTFKITVDVSEASGSIVENKLSYATRANSANDLLKGIRILIVDDSPDNQLIVKRYLEKEGAICECVSNGDDGARRALEVEFQVVLMDLQMPVMDGYQALHKIRASGSKKPVLAFTAHAMKTERERCLIAGFNDYVSKPVDRNALVDAILRAVAKVD